MLQNNFKICLLFMDKFHYCFAIPILLLLYKSLSRTGGVSKMNIRTSSSEFSCLLPLTLSLFVCLFWLQFFGVWSSLLLLHSQLAVPVASHCAWKLAFMVLEVLYDTYNMQSPHMWVTCNPPSVLSNFSTKYTCLRFHDYTGGPWNASWMYITCCPHQINSDPPVLACFKDDELMFLTCT